MKRLAIIAMLANSTAFAGGWDGYDWDKRTYIEVQRNQVVRPGRPVEVFDYREGRYRQMEVQSVDRGLGHTEIRVIDSQTGQPRIFEMDDD